MTPEGSGEDILTGHMKAVDIELQTSYALLSFKNRHIASKSRPVRFTTAGRQRSLFELDIGLCAIFDFFDDVDHGRPFIGRPVPDSAAVIIPDAAPVNGCHASVRQCIQAHIAADTPPGSAPGSAPDAAYTAG